MPFTTNWIATAVATSPITRCSLGLWFVSQFFMPLESGVGWMAHVGGFLAGLGLVRILAPARTRPKDLSALSR